MKFNKWSADPDIDKAWNDYISGEEAREKKKHLGNRLTNRAIRAFLASLQSANGTEGIKLLVPTGNQIVYDGSRILRAAEKASEAARAIAEAVSELAAPAAGHLNALNPQSDPPESIEQSLRDAKAEVERLSARTAGYTDGLQERSESSRKSKRYGH